jgi:hypothetical protein
MDMGDGKAKNVIEYLDNLIEKGKATGTAVRPLKVAFSKVVLVIDGDSWEQTDVRSIDVDDYMTRFSRLTNGQYARDSLAAYKSRFNRAIKWYLKFMDTPGWSPDVEARNRSAKIEVTKTSTKIGKNIAVNSSPIHIYPPEVSFTSVVSTEQINYPFPLSDGQLVHISLPIKLSKKDAKRIAAFIERIAIDEQLTIGPGHE